MIPDHLIDRAAAVHAEHIGSRAQADGFFMPIKRGQLPLPRVAIEAMERALEAVAADIWEQGAESGWQATGEGWNGEYANGTTHDGAQSFRDAGNGTPNPYRASETA